MKKSLTLAILALSMLAGIPEAMAENLDCKTSVLIPERFAVSICSNVDPATLKEKTVLQSAKQTKEELGIEQICIAFYEPDKKTGDGVVAFAAYGGLNPKGYFTSLSDDKEEVRKFFEKLIGYEIKPQALWQIYDDNEVVADEDFKGKPLLLKVKNTGLAKDVAGKPYLKVPTDQFGLEGLQIFLSKNDPFLRKLKKGQTLGVRAFPRGFIMQSVILDGEVFYIEEPKGKKK